MPAMRKKSDLPTKMCPACARPFSWRKKWRNNWAAVLYCSDKCRQAGRGKPAAPAQV